MYVHIYMCVLYMCACMCITSNPTRINHSITSLNIYGDIFCELHPLLDVIKIKSLLLIWYWGLDLKPLA